MLQFFLLSKAKIAQIVQMIWMIFIIILPEVCRTSQKAF